VSHSDVAVAFLVLLTCALPAGAYTEKSGDVCDETRILDGVAARDNRYGLRINGTPAPVVDANGCTFTENSQYGVCLHGTSNSQWTLIDSAVHSNLGSCDHCAYYFTNPHTTVVNSSIHGNLRAYDLHTYSYDDPERTVVDATDNRWGTTEPGEIAGRSTTTTTGRTLPTCSSARSGTSPPLVPPLPETAEPVRIVRGSGLSSGPRCAHRSG
jgi:hypothetical protein